MSNTIHISEFTKVEESVHLLPCCIESDGPARVSTYFLVEPSDESPDILEASFRGRQLKGHVFPMPDNMVGYVVEKQSESVDNENHISPEISFSATSKFHSITHWNHDVPPSSVESVDVAYEWLQLSQRLSTA